jgi:hypothetical protein
LLLSTRRGLIAGLVVSYPNGSLRSRALKRGECIAGIGVLRAAHTFAKRIAVRLNGSTAGRYAAVQHELAAEGGL